MTSKALLLDTSALLYWTLAPSILTPAASKALRKASEIYVSGISLWEIGVKADKGRLLLPVPLRDYVGRLQSVDKVSVLDVGLEDWLATVELAWAHRDLADRVLVASAMRRHLPLITSDAEIRRFYPDAIW